MNNRRNIIIVVVVVILLCCCCSMLGIGAWYAWNNGDSWMGGRSLGLLLPTLLML
jgi:hypothetical protein